MNDEGLMELLTNLLLAQDSASVAIRTTDDYSDRNIAMIFAARDSIRNTILSEFAALRQQRDGLAKLCMHAYVALVAHWDWRGTKSGQRLLCRLRDTIADLTGKTAREVQETAEEKAADAALASIGGGRR